MVKKTVKLEFTSNERSRRTKFKHRTKSLIKKIEQLSILCGIDVGAIIFAKHADAHQQLLVWPPQPQHLHQLLTLYKQKAKAKAKEVQVEAEPEAAEPSDTSSTASSHSQTQNLLPTSSGYHHLSLSLHQLNQLLHIMDRRIAAVDNKIQFLRKSKQGMPEEEVSNLSHSHRCPHAVHCCCRGCAVVDPGCSHHRGLNITLHGTCNS
ncbi:MADS-box protein FBP24-like isoform X2 [Ipomoea triloba]|nr:MADS-box protein FBP24-like isoform X2 [Ipomoea triloba]